MDSGFQTDSKKNELTLSKILKKNNPGFRHFQIVFQFFSTVFLNNKAHNVFLFNKKEISISLSIKGQSFSIFLCYTENRQKRDTYLTIYTVFRLNLIKKSCWESLKNPQNTFFSREPSGFFKFIQLGEVFFGIKRFYFGIFRKHSSIREFRDKTGVSDHSNRFHHIRSFHVQIAG